MVPKNREPALIGHRSDILSRFWQSKQLYLNPLLHPCDTAQTPKKLNRKNSPRSASPKVIVAP